MRRAIERCHPVSVRRERRDRARRCERRPASSAASKDSLRAVRFQPARRWRRRRGGDRSTAAAPSSARRASASRFETCEDSAENASCGIRCVRALEIDALVFIGGDDTLKTARTTCSDADAACPVRCGAPAQTIDNDYNGIDWTFGFDRRSTPRARRSATVRDAASSHERTFVLEVMGRKRGIWLTYAAGIGGTDATKMISVEDVWRRVRSRRRRAARSPTRSSSCAEDGRRYGIVWRRRGTRRAAARARASARWTWTRQRGGARLGVDRQMLRQPHEKCSSSRGAGFSDEGAAQADRLRGSLRRPTAFDVMLGSQLGVGACRALVDDGLTGVMVSVEVSSSSTYVPRTILTRPGVALRSDTHLVA